MSNFLIVMAFVAYVYSRDARRLSAHTGSKRHAAMNDMDEHYEKDSPDCLFEVKNFLRDRQPIGT